MHLETVRQNHELYDPFKEKFCEAHIRDIAPEQNSISPTPGINSMSVISNSISKSLNS